MQTKRTLLVAVAAALTIVSIARSAPAEAPPAKRSFTVQVTGQGRPVILVPGLSCSGAVWDGTVAHLKDRCQCHVLTLAGFAGQPRIPAPFLETVRNEHADYVREQKLDHPVIVGHSLGGFLTLWLASHDPKLPGPLLIVDAQPFLAAAMMPNATVETARPMAETWRTRMAVPAAQFVTNSARTVKTMVTRPEDFDRVMSWVKATDPQAAADGMFEMLTHDLRGDIARIESPTLVLGTWIAFRDYMTEDETAGRFHKQYAALKNCRIVMAETRHFIMLDDPAWFYQQLDAFLASPGSR